MIVNIVNYKSKFSSIVLLVNHMRYHLIYDILLNRGFYAKFK